MSTPEIRVNGVSYRLPEKFSYQEILFLSKRVNLQSPQEMDSVRACVWVALNRAGVKTTWRQVLDIDIVESK